VWIERIVADRKRGMIKDNSAKTKRVKREIESERERDVASLATVRTWRSYLGYGESDGPVRTSC